MTAKFFAILTSQGAALLANATALGTKLDITQMAVGDGNGTLPVPEAAQTKLVNQKRIAPLNMLSVDANNASQIIAEQVIPENEGGFWIREIGLYDSNGVLIAVANCPETYKPQLQEGSGRTQTIRMVLIVSSTAAVTLKIDPSVVLATRKYVDDAVIEVKAYADDVMKKHISAANPHKQYLVIANALKELAEAGLIGDVFRNLGLGSAAKTETGDYISSGGGNYPAYLRMTGVETLPTSQAAANLSSLYSAPAPIPANVIVAGGVANWYRYQGMWGLIRNSSDGIQGWGVQINGVTKFMVTPEGDCYASNQKLATEFQLTDGLAGKQDSNQTLNDLSGKNQAQLRDYLQLGSAATKTVGNGAGQVPDMSYFPLSGGISGYVKLPNGFIFQWGQSNAGNGSVNIPFPLMFPGGCVGVEVTGTSARASNDMAGVNIIAGEINAGGFGVNGYIIRPGAQVISQGVAFVWCAWGY